MISEKELANGFSGFWADCLPFLSPSVIAEFNLSGEPITDRWGGWIKPLAGLEVNSQNDLVAETAFGLFAATLKLKQNVVSLANNEELVKKISDSAARRIGELRRTSQVGQRLITAAFNQSIEMAKRLEAFFTTYASMQQIIIQPRFNGCGILNSCFGDIVAGNCLYEVKMVDRNLRSADVRQVLIYCALNHGSQQYMIDELSILNPRRGIEFRYKVEELTLRVSGRTSFELFHQITDFLSNFETAHQPS